MSAQINDSDPQWVKRIKKDPRKVKWIMRCCWVFLILSILLAPYFIYDLVYRWNHRDELVRQEFYAICMGSKEKVYFNETYPEYVCGELNPFLAEQDMGNLGIDKYFDQNNFTYQTYGEIER